MLFLHAALVTEEGLLMTPRTTDTDGFYVAVMRKA
jgi:16S rRNA (cytosine967-C5)-methyltransferase